MKTHNQFPRAAIVVSFYGPTNHLCSRLKVKTQRGSKVYSFGTVTNECYYQAVSAWLAEIEAQDKAKYGPAATGWGKLSDYSVGHFPNGDWVFVSNV